MTHSLLFRAMLPAVLLGAAITAPRPSGSPASTGILVDQAGYTPRERKLAYVEGGSGSFAVVDAQGKVAFSGTVGPAVQAADSGKAYAPADFTALTKPGTYAIRLAGGERSPRFGISGEAHAEALDLALRAFSSQRCGVAVRAGLPQDHAPCHLEDGVLWKEPSRHVPSVGGWHDAGDYGKYAVNGAYSAALLLTLAERRVPAGLAERLRQEARWELEWLLTMQAPDGSVYHKLTARKHPGVVPAEGDRSERFLFPPTSPATGDFAAALAIAARVYRSGDAAFARTCGAASERAWQWLQAHPEPVRFRQPPGVNTGQYGDKEDRDERLWAAVERHRSTGDKAALAEVRRIAGDRLPAFTYAGSWADVANVALLSLLEDERIPRDDPLRARIRGDLVSFARRLASRCWAHALGVALRPGDYYWGSNGVALNFALLLLEGGRYGSDPAVVQAGRDQVHYLLGRNTLGLSFVTGVGERRVLHPHHAPSILTKARPPLPGLLVGGPNFREGRALSEFPATAYTDSADNWTVNEPAINLNAELVLALGLLTASR